PSVPPAPDALVFRPAAEADAGWWADLMTAVEPTDPWDPELLAHEWRFDDRDAVVGRWILEAGGRRLGFGETYHDRWERTDERYVYVNARLWPGAGGDAELNAAYDELESRARADRAADLQSVARADEHARLRFLEGRGYRRERLGRVWELDLNERRDHILAMTEEARAHMREQGVDLRTFDGWDDRRALEKLYELT